MMMSKESYQVLEAMRAEIIFFFSAFGAAAVNFTSQGWPWLHNKMWVFIQYMKRTELYFSAAVFWFGELIQVQFHSTQISNIILNLLLIMSSANRSKAPPQPLAKKKKKDAHASTELDKQQIACNHMPSTDHLPCIGWASGNNLNLIVYDGRLLTWLYKNYKEMKSRLQSKVWESSMRGGESEVGVCNNRWRSKPWSAGGGVLESSITVFHPRQLYFRFSRSENGACSFTTTYRFGCGGDVLHHHFAFGA